VVGFLERQPRTLLPEGKESISFAVIRLQKTFGSVSSDVGFASLLFLKPCASRKTRLLEYTSKGHPSVGPDDDANNHYGGVVNQWTPRKSSRLRDGITPRDFDVFASV